MGNHIKSIKIKNSKGTGILNKANKYLNLSTLVTLYHSLIYPYLTYCLEVWGGAGDIYLLSLFKLQKRMVRIMKSLPHRAHIEPIFLDLKLINMYQLYKQRILLFIFNIFVVVYPNCLIIIIFGM